MDDAIGLLEGGADLRRVIVDGAQVGDDVGAGDAVDADGTGEGGHDAAADIAHRTENQNTHQINPSIWSCNKRKA